MQPIEKTALIFSGGNCFSLDVFKKFLPDDLYIICADSGAVFCEKFGLSANLIVGDFDSSEFQNITSLKCAQDAEIIKLNPQKDDTDTEFAITCAIDRGYNRIFLAGGIGSRMDHTLANVFLMEKCAVAGCEMIVLNENNIMHYVSSGSVEIHKNEFKYISILPLEEAVVSNRGFKYPLDCTLMHRCSSLGISNELNTDTGTITVHSGSVLVIESRD